MAVADRSARFDGGGHMSVWVTQFHPAVGRDGLALWPFPSDERGGCAWKGQRIKPSRLCASPPFPFQNVSHCHWRRSSVRRAAPQAREHWQVPWRHSTPHPLVLFPRTLAPFQTPGMEVDHTVPADR